jgi:hypothetical protein
MQIEQQGLSAVLLDGLGLLLRADERVECCVRWKGGTGELGKEGATKVP